MGGGEANRVCPDGQPGLRTEPPRGASCPAPGGAGRATCSGLTEGGSPLPATPRPSPHEHPRKAASSAGEEPATPFQTSQLPTRVFPGTRGEDRPLRPLPRPVGAGESRRDAGGRGGRAGLLLRVSASPPPPSPAQPARLPPVCSAGKPRAPFARPPLGAASPGALPARGLRVPADVDCPSPWRLPESCARSRRSPRAEPGPAGSPSDLPLEPPAAGARPSGAPRPPAAAPLTARPLRPPAARPLLALRGSPLRLAPRAAPPSPPAPPRPSGAIGRAAARQGRGRASGEGGRAPPRPAALGGLLRRLGCSAAEAPHRGGGVVPGARLGWKGRPERPGTGLPKWGSRPS